MLCTVNDIAPRVAGFLVMVDHSTICVRILFFYGQSCGFHIPTSTRRNHVAEIPPLPHPPGGQLTRNPVVTLRGSTGILHRYTTRIPAPKFVGNWWIVAYILTSSILLVRGASLFGFFVACAGSFIVCADL